jgi:hypothetical protein
MVLIFAYRTISGIDFKSINVTYPPTTTVIVQPNIRISLSFFVTHARRSSLHV